MDANNSTTAYVPLKLDAIIAFRYIVPLIIIAFIIGLYNLYWAVRHSLRIRKLNLFNVGLVACTSFFLLNVISVLIFPAVKYSYLSRNVKPTLEYKRSLSIFTNLFNRITWTITTLIYLLLVQSR